MKDENKKISGNFTFSQTSISGVLLVESRSYPDERGWFMETYKRSDFEVGGIGCTFVQDNHSRSSKGVLRGLHYQKKHPQAKLVRVIYGEIFDVCVDLREDSPTFGKWVSAVLTADNHRQMFIPRGFAHGFLTLSDFAEIIYKCDDEYHPGDEAGIMWNDCAIGIKWPPVDGCTSHDPSAIILSSKDRNNPPLNSLFISF